MDVTHKGRLGESVEHPSVPFENPGWVRRQIDWTRTYHGDRDRMRVALLVARLNIEQKTGGPFGAAVFDDATDRIVSVGANRVGPLGSALLHAETVAIALAEKRLGSPGLAPRDDPPRGPFLLYTSCEPCVLCLGAAMVAGCAGIVSAADVADAADVAIDPHPAPSELWQAAKEQGIEVREHILRDEARAIFAQWRAARRPR